ncbi:MAG: hypothetical protein H5T86_02370, partial [Armatimonadetes bacterium]|nr:hypothetical protein [Armatimonadota bacterium]
MRRPWAGVITLIVLAAVIAVRWSGADVQLPQDVGASADGLQAPDVEGDLPGAQQGQSTGKGPDPEPSVGLKQQTPEQQSHDVQDQPEPQQPPQAIPQQSSEGGPPPPAERKLGELVNGGFEAELAGWEIISGTETNVSIDPGAAKSGKRCLRLSAPRSGINPGVTQRIELPGKPGWLRLRFFLRPTLVGRARLVCRVELAKTDGSILRQYFLQDVNADPTQWREKAARVPLTGEETKVRLSLRLVATGAAWIDDVEAQFEPADLLLIPRRLVAVEGQEQVVRLRLLGEAGGEMSASLDGVPLGTEVEDREVAIRVPELKPGKHRVEVQRGEAKDEVELWVAPARKKPVMLTDDGWWELKGQPTGVTAIMHADISDLAAAAEQGFNAVQLLPPSGRDPIKRLLKSFPRDGPGLILPFDLRPAGPEREQYLKASLEALSEASSDRRVLAWLLADEADVRLDLEDTPAVYLEARRRDSLHPLAITLGGPYDVDLWRAFADCILVNVCRWADSPEHIFQVVRDVAAHLEPWQPVGAILPAGWSPSAPQPDASKARLNAFAAAAAGCRVYAWYCLRATGWDLRASPLWPALGEINRDLLELSAAVAGLGPASDVTVSGVPISAAWDGGDQRIVLVVNTAAAEQQVTVSTALPVTSAEAIVGSEKPVLEEGRTIATLGPQKIDVLKLYIARD